ncbi:chemotaxis protein CheW [Orenia marismortui]|uniref:Purine-binding chemotaxis protein CheW n=1 Tax=Orenia marismortui TaxID=46469 RepID=A0A4R8GYE2_9FIRM|nr:chemotaxis protein CheW [Orenia marismortui]TDX51356.1 purine-binding chemotaxis protein CheW [Orenia marismortui]
MANETGQIIVFDIGTEKFGVKITEVHEIIRMKEITELPIDSSYIAGIINLRGDIISVIDLRKRFALKDIKKTDDTRIIVVEFEGQNVGLIVDAVSEVLHIDENNIDTPPKSMSGIKNDYIRGIIKINEDIVVLLELDNLLKSKEKIELDNDVKVDKGV